MLRLFRALSTRAKVLFATTFSLRRPGKPECGKTTEAESGPAIPAECHSDDGRYEAVFDARPWFEQASDAEILALADVGWGGDYAADAVARFLEDQDADLDRVFDYLSRGPTLANGNPVGFECHVEPEPALRWLREHRPPLAQRLETGGADHDGQTP